MDVSRVSVSIQFNTKTCRVGTQLLSDFNDNPSRVSALSWSDTVDIDMIPSVFLGVDNEIAAFGNEAKKLWLHKKKGRYFENVIKSLYSLETFDGESNIHDCRGDSYYATKIMVKLICFIRQFAMSRIKSVDDVLILGKTYIKWVLALPSVRAEESFKFFKDAWNQAYPSDKVVITSYADAALTYHVFLGLRRSDGLCFHLSLNGSLIMLIGFEDELDSFNVYEQRDSLDFKQVTHYLSGGSTRNLLKQLIEVFFVEVFGSWVWQMSMQADEDLVFELERMVKQVVESSGDLKQKVTFRCSPALKEVCLEHTNMTMKKVIDLSEHGSRMVLSGDRIFINSEIFVALLKKAVSSTIRNMKYVFGQNDKNVETVILTGNMDSCIMLQKEIKTQFPHMTVCSNKSIGVEVLSGAAMYGHKPIIVSTIFSGAQASMPSRITNQAQVAKPRSAFTKKR